MPYTLTHAKTVVGSIVLDRGIVVTEDATKSVDVLTDNILLAQDEGLITVAMPTAPTSLEVQGEEIEEDSLFSGTASVVPELVEETSWQTSMNNAATLLDQINYNREDIAKLYAIVESMLKNPRAQQ